jgi:hypothetical protein
MYLIDLTIIQSSRPQSPRHFGHMNVQAASSCV